MIIRHIKGDYVAQEENMMKYLQRVKELILTIDNFEIQQIFREKNSKADSLAKVVTTILMAFPKGVHFQQVKTLAIKET